MALTNDDKKSDSHELRAIQGLISTRDTIALKNLCRSEEWGEEDAVRSQLWILLCRRYRKSRSKPEFDNDTAAYLDNSPPQSPRKLPGFVDLTYCRFFNLDVAKQRAVEKVLWSLAREHAEITYCPLLYPLSALFLHYHKPDEVFAALSYLVDAKSSSDSIPFLPETKNQIAKDGYVLVKLTNKFGLFPSNAFFREQRAKLKTEHEIDEVFLEWMKWIFVGLPFSHLIRVVDCFLVEGMKFLFRVALALLIMFRKANPGNGHGHLTLAKMLSFCEHITTSPNDLITLAISLRNLSKVKIVKQYKNAESDLHLHPRLSSMVAAVSPFNTPKLTKRGDMMALDPEKIHISTRIAPRDFKSAIIDWYLLDIIWDWIPERIVVREPTTVFCTDEDGSSLKTFFTKADPYEPTILLIKTVDDEIFGAFCSESWALRFGKDMKGATSQYFGTGETFLFSLSPKVAFYPWIGTHAYDASSSSPTPIAHSSQLFMSASNKQLVVGSGNGNGLWVDEELTKGKSERCDTFNNRPLTSRPNGDFICSKVEVIAFA